MLFLICAVICFGLLFGRRKVSINSSQNNDCALDIWWRTWRPLQEQGYFRSSYDIPVGHLHFVLYSVGLRCYFRLLKGTQAISESTDGHLFGCYST